MRPAFRTTYWQNYPEPFYPGHGGQYPVPGWGVMPVMAGPARVGVGADFGVRASAAPAFTVQQDKFIRPTIEDPAAPDKALPWWVWPLGASALFGVLGYLSVQKGWF